MTWKDIIIFSSLVLGFIIIHIIEHYSGTARVSLDKESIKQEKIDIIMLLKILLIILCCYAFVSIVLSFIFIVSDWEGFCSFFDENERKTTIIILVIFGPIIITAVLTMTLTKLVLNRTIWRADTKKVVEETVSASLSKTLKNYNKYFEKD